MQSSSSQSAPEEMDFSKVLNLRTGETFSFEKLTTIWQPELSGEWIRSKNYICSPYGEIFQDFLALFWIISKTVIAVFGALTYN